VHGSGVARAQRADKSAPVPQDLSEELVPDALRLVVRRDEQLGQVADVAAVEHGAESHDHALVGGHHHGACREFVLEDARLSRLRHILVAVYLVRYQTP